MMKRRSCAPGMTETPPAGGERIGREAHRGLGRCSWHCFSRSVFLSRRIAQVTCIAVIVAAGAVRAGPETQPNPTDSDDTGKRLSEKLIRQAHGNAGEDLMEGIIRLMNTAAQRLEIDFDAGEETQAAQQRIMRQLGEAIKKAAARRREMQDERSPLGDRRRKPKSKTGRTKKSAGPAEDKTASPSSDPANAGSPGEENGRSGGALHESRRGWGHLPPRERDEVIQGAEEGSLERFRTWIERYYQALQESDEAGPR